MKRLLYGALFIAFFASCDKLSDVPETAGENDRLTKASSKDETTSGTIDFTVSLSDIQNYVRQKTEAVQKEGKDLVLKEITPLFKDQRSGFTPLYLLNYDTGWEVISGDKRTPVVLASQSKGTFHYSEIGNGGLTDEILAWLDGEASMIASLQDISYMEAIALSRTPEAQKNVFYWESLSNNSQLPDGGEIGGLRVIIPDVPDPRGHWDILVSRNESLSSSYILNTANWKINGNYPSGPPINLSLTVLAAGKQLYFLYNKWNISQTAATENGYPTITWGNLTTGYNSAVTDFLSALGSYNPDGGGGGGFYPEGFGPVSRGLTYPGTKTDRLVSDAVPLLALYGVSCSTEDYSDSTVYSNIVYFGRPVVASATRFSLFPGLGQKRTFLIDKYRIFDVYTTYTFVWVWDIEPDPEEMIDLIDEPDPIITHTTEGKYAMNWGAPYDATYQTDGDDIWFTASSTWELFGVSLNNNKKVLTGFWQTY